MVVCRCRMKTFLRPDMSMYLIQMLHLIGHRTRRILAHLFRDSLGRKTPSKTKWSKCGNRHHFQLVAMVNMTGAEVGFGKPEAIHTL